jgi:hypothetical protein
MYFIQFLSEVKNPESEMIKDNPAVLRALCNTGNRSMPEPEERAAIVQQRPFPQVITSSS